MSFELMTVYDDLAVAHLLQQKVNFTVCYCFNSIVFFSFQFREIMFVDETTDDKAIFTYELNSPLVASENYGTPLPGLWIGGGVADKNYKYRVVICDHLFYSGFFVSVTINSCFKQCHNWCGDRISPYFRTSTSSVQYSGVAFNVNGHRALNSRLVSVGLR